MDVLFKGSNITAQVNTGEPTILLQSHSFRMEFEMSDPLQGFANGVEVGRGRV